MTKPDDGGPAFPVDDNTLTDGTSLRDWFAGQAIVNVVTADDLTAGSEIDAGVPHRCKVIAEIAYTLADAMLAYRAKERT